MPTPIITDGTMDRLQDAPRVVLPENPVQHFEARADRLRALSQQPDRPIGSYLAFLAVVCDAQAKSIASQSPWPVAEELLMNSRAHGMPPLGNAVIQRPAAWREDLNVLIRSLLETGQLNAAAEESATRLADLTQSDPDQVEALADALLTGLTLDEHGARQVPFVGAALQVFFSRAASALPAEALSHSDAPSLCPCCGSHPTASIVRMDPARVNSRYMVCSLCQTEWNLERVKCTSCLNESGVAYLIIDSDARAATTAAIRAETCDDCQSYLKIFIEEKDPLLEVTADDLASLDLDIMVDERGYRRTGPNLLFYPGHED